MSTTGAVAIQKAVYDALSADVTLAAKISGVFDFVPAPTVFPYVSIGEATVTPFDSETFNGTDNDLYVHTWTQGAGRKLAKEIMDDIYRILHNANLVITGFCAVLCRFTFMETMIDPDGQSYHGIQRFRLIITEV